MADKSFAKERNIFEMTDDKVQKKRLPSQATGSNVY
jgi:hypothetical protein